MWAELEFLGNVMERLPQIDVQSPGLVSLEILEDGSTLDGKRLLAEVRVTMRTLGEAQTLADALGLTGHYRGPIIDGQIMHDYIGLVDRATDSPIDVSVVAYETAEVKA
ncbi:hypothetical protein ACFVDI_09620 [Nocardioides sp. NPDC057767]|uniref:hypothetical protein n=1 Tax=unclassified Nocardioides TaxID=2615069 RepID=UPI00366AA939